MTENEAIKELKYDYNELGKAIPCDTGWGIAINSAYDMAIKALEEIQRYRAIGTVEECREARERQMARKPVYKPLSYTEEYGFRNEWLCPSCGNVVGYFSEEMSEPEQMKYCPDCGQHIARDWSE